jgi:hypothetical protein
MGPKTPDDLLISDSEWQKMFDGIGWCRSRTGVGTTIPNPKLFASLPEDMVYQIALLIYLGRGDFDVHELAAYFKTFKENFDGATALALQLTDKAPLARRNVPNFGGCPAFCRWNEAPIAIRFRIGVVIPRA